MDLNEVPNDVEAVFRQQRAHLLRLAFLLSGSPDTAADAVSAAFVGLVAHDESVRDPAAYLDGLRCRNGVRSCHRHLARALVPASDPA